MSANILKCRLHLCRWSTSYVQHLGMRRLLNMVKQHGQSDSMSPFNHSGSCHGARGRYINGGLDAYYEVEQFECLAMKVAAVCWALSMGYDKIIFKSDSELLNFNKVCSVKCQ